MKIRAGFILELGVNLLLPWLVYRTVQPHFGDADALYASTVPPVVWSLVEFARSRRVDALSVLVLLGIALSIAMMALGGSPRILLMRESLVTGAVGIAFLFSLVLARPLIFYLARASIARQRSGGIERFEMLWSESASFRAAMRLMTTVWGTGLVVETLLRCWIAWHWPVERTLVVIPVIGYSIYGGLSFWTFWFRRRLQRRRQQASAL
ncbi:VC0807 family protein [Paraburkholderia sp.]|uniref:VC0807 family protein n=1 Tax=Paraburkholderia sp. TaxID=1926495 RepID=UPI003D6FDB47